MIKLTYWEGTYTQGASQSAGTAIINDIEPLLLTIHSVNGCFIHHPSNVENYLIGHKLETNQPKQKKGVLENIFLHLYTGFGLKNQTTNGQKSLLKFFDICKIGT